MSVVRRVEPEPERLLVYIVAEGVADYFFARPLDENPYTLAWSDEWISWREGWLWGQFFEELVAVVLATPGVPDK